MFIIREKDLSINSFVATEGTYPFLNTRYSLLPKSRTLRWQFLRRALQETTSAGRIRGLP